MHRKTRIWFYCLSILFINLFFYCTAKNESNNKGTASTELDLENHETIISPENIYGVYYLLNSKTTYESLNTDIGLRIDKNKMYSGVVISLGGEYLFFKDCRVIINKNEIDLNCKKDKKFQLQFLDNNHIVYKLGPNIQIPMDTNEPSQSKQVEPIFETNTKFIRSSKNKGQLSDNIMEGLKK